MRKSRLYRGGFWINDGEICRVGVHAAIGEGSSVCPGLKVPVNDNLVDWWWVKPQKVNLTDGW
eukprot:70213-Hanusia_phi.AAC.1